MKILNFYVVSCMAIKYIEQIFNEEKEMNKLMIRVVNLSMHLLVYTKQQGRKILKYIEI